MNNRISAWMLATAISCLSLGCSQTSTTLSDKMSKESQDIEHHKSVDLKWLKYADPKADANFAIEKQDFALLAFAGRVTSFPGINNESSTLQQQCGYRLLAKSGDALRSQSELSLRKQLYQYAEAYNQLISAACQRHYLSKNS